MASSAKQFIASPFNHYPLKKKINEGELNFLYHPRQRPMSVLSHEQLDCK